jgi:hypothetical protein
VCFTTRVCGIIVFEQYLFRTTIRDKGGATVLSKVVLKLRILVVCLLILNALSFGAEFYFNTKDGMGITGSSDSISYLLGFPYSEVGFRLPLDENRTIFLSTFGGYDFGKSTYFLKLSSDFQVENIIVSLPFELTTKIVETNEPTETGRFNVGLSASINFGNINFSVLAYYSVLYLFYDPAFNVNIPTVYTDNIFRSSLNVKVSYIQPTFSISLGYFASLRWLSYRSSFITGENSPYIEARVKVRF